MVRVPKRFVDDTLWPEFIELSRTLQETLELTTDQIISQVFEQETSEAEILDDQKLVGRWTAIDWRLATWALWRQDSYFKGPRSSAILGMSVCADASAGCSDEKAVPVGLPKR